LSELEWKICEYEGVRNLRVFNTLFIQSINHKGLGCFFKSEQIAFIPINFSYRFLERIYISNSTIFISSHFKTKIIIETLIEFVNENKITLIFKGDYSIPLGSERVFKNYFEFGKKQTLIHNLHDEHEKWFSNIRKKHRYYSKKASTSCTCETYTASDISKVQLKDIFEMHIFEMNRKQVTPLFKDFSAFLSFVESGKKNLFFNLCMIENDIVYFNLTHCVNDIANYIMASSNNLGRSINASYHGVSSTFKFFFSHSSIKYFNFGGIDKRLNPGGYFFKKGFAGQAISSPKLIIISQKRLIVLLFKISFLFKRRKI